jgi:dihydrofolate synthase/folylpolyglutamate synthase
MRSYESVIAALEQRLPMFSRQGNTAFKKGLDNIIALCEALGNPQNRFPAVHIAGTNGKGSTSHLIAAAFQHNGYKAGLYTSPHLIDMRERFRIDGLPVSKDFIIRFMEKAEPLLETIQPSYFELNVAMAFCAFAEAEVDIAVIETGLGGRLDSTNIIRPVLSVITNISLEHTQLLGDTLEAIAREKAGIIKEKIPVVIGEIQPETERVFIRTAFAKHAPVYFAERLWELVPAGHGDTGQGYKAVSTAAPDIIPFQTDLMGSFQAHNIKTALAALQLLELQGWRLPLRGVLESFGRVKATTGLRGRWDWIQKRPNIILDVAHNAAGIQCLLENVRAAGLDAGGTLHILCGFVRDKDIPSVLGLLPENAIYYFTAAQVPRALPAEDLEKRARESRRLRGQAYPDVHNALHAALAQLEPEDSLLITGSFFIVGEAMAELLPAEPAF